jgi:hypothetical protein
MAELDYYAWNVIAFSAVSVVFAAFSLFLVLRSQPPKR